jgi:hypothetical protein
MYDVMMNRGKPEQGVVLEKNFLQLTDMVEMACH